MASRPTTADFGRNLLQGLPSPRYQANFGALFSQRQGDGPADSATRPCDDGYLIF
jgi:hypothetical protein